MRVSRITVAVIATLASLVLVANAQFPFLNNLRLPSFPRFRRPRPSQIQMPTLRMPTFRMPRVRAPTFMTNLFSRPTSSSSLVSRPTQPAAVPSQPAAPATSPITRPTQPVQPAAASSSSSSSSSSGGSANHSYQGRNYLLTWRQGRNGFSHSAAKSFCRGQGMRIVSLDSIAKATHFMNLLEADGAPYFWAGGEISR